MFTMLVHPIKLIKHFDTNPAIEHAKKKPIEEMYQGQLRKTGNVLMGICPVHNEKTPSFAIYPKTNTCYCFSCGFSGDAITFYMQINKVDFKTALEALKA